MLAKLFLRNAFWNIHFVTAGLWVYMYVYLNTCVYIWYFGLKVKFFLFIRYCSKYFFQNSCLYSFSPYTAVFLSTVFLLCSTLNSLPAVGIFDQIFWIDRTACSAAAFAVERCKCLDLCLPVRNNSEFAILTHKALGSIKKEQTWSCWLALPCHFSF